MAEPLSKDSWIWVIVMEPETDPQYLGQEDEKSGVAYIPAFLSKEDAQQGVLNLSMDRGKKIEIQAVMYDHLGDDAATNGFQVFIVSAQGAILQRISPADSK